MPISTGFSALTGLRWTVALDGFPGVSQPLSVEGGNVKMEETKVQDTTSNIHLRTGGNYSIDPIKFAFGTSVGQGVKDALKAAYDMNPKPFGGVITMYDTTGAAVQATTFTNAWINEVGWDKAEASKGQTGKMTVSITPETALTTFSGGEKGKNERKDHAQKLFSTSNFRLSLDGFENFYTAVDLPKFTQKIVPEAWGHTRHPVLVPSLVEIGDLVLTMPTKYRPKVQELHKKAVHDGDYANSEFNGTFEWLDATLQKTLATITLTGCGVKALQTDSLDTAGGKNSTFTVTCYVTSMNIDLPAG